MPVHPVWRLSSSSSLLVVTADQLVLLQYRLSMSSLLYQPQAPPGSGTHHTYQVLLPYNSALPPWGLLEVKLGSVGSESRLLLMLTVKLPPGDGHSHPGGCSFISHTFIKMIKKT